MTISIVNGNRGTATEKISDQTLALIPSGNFTVGNYALLAVAIDNTGAGEGQTDDVSVTDTPGNPWTKLREQTESNTTALTGVTCALFLAEITVGLTTGDTINIALAANSTAKGAGLAELSVDGGNFLEESAGGSNGSNAAAATTYSVALIGLTNVAGLYVGMSAAEEEVDAAVTLDAAYSALAFGSLGSGTGGVPTSNVRARVGTLAETSTGNTFDATVNAADRATILARLEEVTPPGPVDFGEIMGVTHRFARNQRAVHFRLSPPVVVDPEPLPPVPPEENLAPVIGGYGAM